MTVDYPFKRSFCYDVKAAIKENSVTFVLGTRRCGKTVCLRQLAESFSQSGEFEKVIYTDAKRTLGDNLAKSQFINSVRNAIENDESVLFLIDEATYLNQPDGAIMDVQDAFTCHNNSNTRVVFTGSQSVALDCWGHRAFAGDAAYITADFLSYPEWLAFKGVSEVSEDTYLQFIRGTREFYKNFRSTKDYLRGCLDETVISNQKSLNIVYNNDCSGLNEEMLLDVLYASLMSLHNHVNYQTFTKREVLTDTISRFFADKTAVLGDEFTARVYNILASRYENFHNMTAAQLLKSLQFLDNCGLITVTHVTGELKTDTYYTKNLLSDFGEKPSKEQLMRDLNVCVKYPMFYVDIVQSLLGEKMPDKLQNNLLGGIVECHIRGLLSNTGCLEYHKDGCEIDYVNFSECKAVEMSVRNKKAEELNFDVLPDTFIKIALTKDQDYIQRNGLVRVPYYQFVFENSVGRELLQKGNFEASRKPKRPKSKYDRTDD